MTLKQAMAAVDAAEDNVVQIAQPSRAREIHENQKTLPSLRRESLVRNFEREIEALRAEMLQREAVAQSAIERLTEQSGVEEALLKAAIDEAGADRKAEMARFDKLIDGLRDDLTKCRHDAQIKQQQIIKSSQDEIKQAQKMMDMLSRALDGGG